MERYSRYEDALVAKLRIHEWYSTNDGTRYLHGFFKDLNARHAREEQLAEDGLVYLQKQMIRRSDPIYVGDEIVEIVDRARWTFEPETLLPGDPFVPCGFAIFPRPIILDDAPWEETAPGRYKEGVPVRALGWLAMHDEIMETGCYWISFFTHIEDEPEERSGYVRDPAKYEYFRRFAPLSLVHQWQWTWGSNPLDEYAEVVTTQGETEEQGRARAQMQAALVQTFWRIGQQKVTVPERVPRGIWRDAQRKGLMHRDVKVMLLRRAYERHEIEPSGRQMKVRSITDGHWKNQYYRSMGPARLADGSMNPESHRQIWISPYVRGPEGAPFIHPDKAVEFTR